ncbi:MAG: hypothetical protein ABIQ30_02155, partial [Devosia sp.]
LKNLPEIDDGTGPIPFDFRKFKLSSAYDGIACAGEIYGNVGFGQFKLGVAKVTISNGGHLSFENGHWNSNGLATPDTFARFNLAVTDSKGIVGVMPVFNIVIERGMVPVPPAIIKMVPKAGDLTGDPPQARVLFKIPDDTPGRLDLFCRRG